MRTGSSILWLQAIALTLTQVLAPAASAQADLPPNGASVAPTELATQKFREGKAAATAGRNAEAISLLQQSLDLVPSPNTRNALATVLGRMEQYVSAYKQFQRSASEAASRIKAGEKKLQEAKDFADRALVELDQYVSRLRLQVPPEVPPDFYITIDNEKIPSTSWGKYLPIDPGKHLVVAGTKDSRWFERQLTLAVRERQDLPLPGEPLSLSPPPPPATRLRLTRRHLFYGTVAVAGATLVAGTIVGIVAQLASNNAQQSQPASISSNDLMALGSARRQIQSEAQATDVLLTIGITTAVVSAILAAQVQWRKPALASLAARAGLVVLQATPAGFQLGIRGAF